jgi:O-Antigen ligase
VKSQLRPPLARERFAALDWPLVVTTGVVTTAVALSDGGYFPSAWGWSALLLLWIAAATLVLRDHFSFGRFELAMLAAVTAFVGWVALSSTWSTSPERSILEVQRDLVYIGGVLVIVVVARGRTTCSLLVAAYGVALITSTVALTRFFFPDRFSSRDEGFARLEGIVRLSDPLGYPNALALVAVMGALLAAGFAAHAGSQLRRASCAASLVVFVATIFFTFSRGGWISLALASSVMLAVDPRRLALLRTVAAVAPAAGVAVWLGSRADALTSPDGTPSDAAHQGHILAVTTVALAVTAALATVAVSVLVRRVSLGRRAALAAATSLLIVALAAPAAAIAHHGAMPRFGRLYDGPLTQNRQRDLTKTNLSARVPLWRQAWHDWRAHSALGSGAGTFEQYWDQHRRTAANVRDAHSLYLETLAELGPLGLVLLLTMLAVPLLVVWRTRSERFAPAAFAAYLAYLVSAAGDWDWEMPAVTLLGLFCGISLLLAARAPRARRSLSATVRAAAVFGTLVLVLVAFTGLIGNGALAASERAEMSQQWQQSAAAARRAIRWLPWSGEAWRRLAIAETGEGNLAAARASLRKAIAKSPQEWRPWVRLMRLSRGREQRRAVREAAGLNPRDPEVVQFLLAPGSLIRGWSYDDTWIGWPVAPMHRQHAIRSAFLDPRAGTLRTGGGAAYHSGIDITVRDDRPEPGAPPGRTHRVYAVEGGTATLPQGIAHGACLDRKVDIGHFAYWHVDTNGVITDGEQIRPGQMIGWTCKGLWHVHLAERLDLYGQSVYVNPVHEGMKLGPYTDREPPRIHALDFYRPAMPEWTAAVRTALPPAGVRFPHTRAGRVLLSGRVDVRAWIDDPEPRLSRRTEPPALVSPTTPYGIAFEVVRESDDRIVLRRTVFRAAVFLGDSKGTQSVPIGYHYAPGTEQALAAGSCLKSRSLDCGGTYWFRLFARPTSTYWDTRRTADGNYRIRVSAWDAAGNRALRTAAITIRNRRQP